MSALCRLTYAFTLIQSMKKILHLRRHRNAQVSTKAIYVVVDHNKSIIAIDFTRVKSL